MKIFLGNAWERLRGSYWFVPTLLAIGAIALSALTLHIDASIEPEWARHSAWVWGGGPEGARSVLATIASSTITVAGVVFSITIVTLTLASSQFGPRLLRNFMTDRGTQLVLGVFVSAFLYCLLVLRAIRGTEQVTVVPFVSVTSGVAFAVASVGFLIYFVHHISTSIIAENVIARVSDDLRANIDRLYPAGDASSSNAVDSLEMPAFPDADVAQITSAASGFIQAIAYDNLVELARQRGLTIRLLRRPGEFVAEGALLVEAAPRANRGADLRAAILAHVYLGRDRTPSQDVEYSIDQLVEVAVRALSPGVNDPFTALTCVEWLGASLIRIAQRPLPSPVRTDAEGALRLVLRTTTFEGLAGAALNQVRRHGASSVAVTVRVLEVLTRIAPHLLRSRDRSVLLEHAHAMHDDGVRAAGNQRDKRDIELAFNAACYALSASAS